jgi:flagellar M-ring protein FliF
VQAQAAAASPAAAAAAPPPPVPPLLQAGNAAAQPASAAAAKTAGLPVYPMGASLGEGETASEETGSYAVTRHLLHVEQGPGRLLRLTAAVVVNDRMASEGAGKLAHVVWKPRSPEEMLRLEQLARAAVGFDAARGDQVVIENVSFSSNVPEATPVGVGKLMDQTDSLLHAQPGLLKTLSFSILGLLLVLMILKPISAQIMLALKQSSLELPDGAQPGGIGSGTNTKAFERMAASLGEVRPKESQTIHEHVAEQIRKGPEQSTRLLESWINAPIEEQD